jgi:hypothetical protein
MEGVLDQWFGPDHVFFKLRADDGNVYVLRHETAVTDRTGILFRPFENPAGHVDEHFLNAVQQLTD